MRPGKNKGVDCNINVTYTRLDIQGMSHPNAGQHPQQPPTEHGCSKSDGYLARLVSDTDPVTMTTLFQGAITFRHVSEFVSKQFSEFGLLILPQGKNRRPSRENMVKTTRNHPGHLSLGPRSRATSWTLFDARSWRPPGSGSDPELERPLSKRPGSLREAPLLKLSLQSPGSPPGSGMAETCSRMFQNRLRLLGGPECSAHA